MVINLPADVLAPSNARPPAGIVQTTELNFCLCLAIADYKYVFDSMQYAEI